MSNIIDSLKRLERAGAENSRATKKLHEAARDVAGKIEAMVPVGVTLPRGYQVIRLKSNVGSGVFLIRQVALTGYDYDLYVDGTGGHLHGDFHCPVTSQTRSGSLQFAKDTAEGLLDEIAEFLEQRAAGSDEAALMLEKKAS